MIKVNLLKNRGNVSDTSATQLDFDMPITAPGEGSGGASEIVAKVFTIILPVLILWGYETYNIGNLSSQNEVAQSRMNELNTEITQNKPVVEKAKAMQKEIKELEERIVLIKNLSKVRLREIKAIDYLQNVIPEKVWFIELDFKDTNFQARGFSVSEEALNKFIESLEGKSFFRNVILMQSVDQKTKTGTVKSFTFSSSLTSTD